METKLLYKDGIKLRAPEPEDVDVLFALENDTSLWHLSNTLTPFSRFDLEQFILSSDHDIFASKQARFMVEKTDQDPSIIIGAVDLFDFDPHNARAGVGIIILEKYRLEGYAVTVLDILTDYAFRHLNLHQLYCNIEVSNEKSLKLFQKKGFKAIGNKLAWNRHGNEWADEIMLQLINEK